MSLNDIYQQADSLQFKVPTTVKSGDPLLIGALAGVATESYISTPTATPTGYVNVCLKGAFLLTVSGVSVISPPTNAGINPGDKLYADGGVLDVATNVTTGFTIDKNASAVLYGSALDAVAPGALTLIRVRLKVAA